MDHIIYKLLEELRAKYRVQYEPFYLLTGQCDMILTDANGKSYKVTVSYNKGSIRVFVSKDDDETLHDNLNGVLETVRMYDEKYYHTHGSHFVMFK